MEQKEGVILSGAKLRNIFGFENIECKFNEGANYIYGKNGSGKSTLTLSGLWACIKGIAEQGEKFLSSRFRCIGGNGASGDIEYRFTDRKDGSEFVIRNHVTKAANQITFQKVSGDPIAGEFLDDFLNISLLSARNFCRMTPQQQAIALGIDTSVFDSKIKQLKEDRKVEARLLKEKGVPEVVEKVEAVSIEALRSRREEIVSRINEGYRKNRETNKALKDEFEQKEKDEKQRKETHNAIMDTRKDVSDSATSCLNTLVSLGYSGNEVQVWIDSLPKVEEFVPCEILEPKYLPEYAEEQPELDAIDIEIQQAYETNQKATAYVEYVIKLESIKKLQEKILSINDQIAAEELERINYINGKKFPFAGMSTDETGALLFKDRTISEQNFSKGELEIIVAKLAASQNPLFKTRFIDEFGVLDPDNQETLVNCLVAEGFQVIVSIPGERVEHDNAIVLRDCKIVGAEDNDERPELL